MIHPLLPHCGAINIALLASYQVAILKGGSAVAEVHLLAHIHTQTHTSAHTHIRTHTRIRTQTHLRRCPVQVRQLLNMVCAGASVVEYGG